jgi:hypothetical protein
LKDKGFVISFILSLVVLVVFFHGPLFNANTVYFGTAGDGIQIYYTSLFHVLHDKSYLYQEAMNYPYKESVFFTGCQPIITDFIKFFGLQSCTIGILNLTMLFSLPISVWFLYFIFKEFNVHYLVSALAAVAIGYFTPQVCRMGAHYTLAYSFAIPAIIWMMIKFYKNPSFKKTIWISVLVFFMASTHMYFFLFYALIISSVWAVFFYTHKFKESLLLFIKHFSLQLVVPLILLQFIIFILNDSTDRTDHPWGFFEYTSNWTGVFYPFGRYYEYLFKNNNLESIPVSGEGLSFVGLCATFLTLIFVLKILRNILNFDFKNILNFADSPVLNGLILCGFISLLYSFAWPFIFGYQELVYKLGFLQQMRALGRFAWIFFYVINIALVVVIANLPNAWNKFYFKTALISFVLFVLSYDAHMNIINYNTTLNNHINELEDINNTLPENQWVKKINPGDFQAILPLPYFHVGSENASIEPKDNFQLYAYIASLKTGLSLISVMSSRISLSQTYKSMSLVKEPNGRVPEILNEFKNQKDILVIAKKAIISNKTEEGILNLCELIEETKNFSLYKLSIGKLKDFYKNYGILKKREYSKLKLYLKDGYYSTDSLNRFAVNDFEKESSDTGFVSIGSIKGQPSKYFTLFNDSISNLSNDSLYTISFWVKDFSKDLYPRTTLAIDAYNNGAEYGVEYIALKECFKQISGNWALIECSFKLRHPSDRVKAVLWHTELIDNDVFEVDKILFRPSNINVYRDFNNFMLINNCIYYYD